MGKELLTDLVANLGGAVTCAGENAKLQGVKGSADVARGRTGNFFRHILGEGHRNSLFLGQKIGRPLYGLDDIVGGKLLELENGASREDSVINVEEGVFGGGGDEGNVTRLDVFEKYLLLLFVEGLNLVEVKQYAARRVYSAKVADYGLDVGGGGGGGV